MCVSADEWHQLLGTVPAGHSAAYLLVVRSYTSHISHDKSYQDLSKTS